jgi:hypothetical protein
MARATAPVTDNACKRLMANLTCILLKAVDFRSQRACLERVDHSLGVEVLLYLAMTK